MHIHKALKATLVCGFVMASTSVQTYAKKNLETSLLKTNQSFRSNLSSQPNLDKGEVTMPVQVSIIYIIKQSLPDFFSQLASRNGLKLTLSDEVNGTLEKISLPMQLELILRELAKSHGLEWHMQGKHLFVSNTLENTNRLIKLEGLTVTELKKAIAQSGLNPGSNKMSFTENDNAMTLIGSAQYIAKIKALVKEHKAKAQ